LKTWRRKFKSSPLLYGRSLIKSRISVPPRSCTFSSLAYFRRFKKKKQFHINYFSLFRNKDLSQFSRNRYFLRIVNAFFVAFSMDVFDPVFIVNALVYEFQVLQRRQQTLIYLAETLLGVLFKIYKDKLRLQGLQIRLKGKITL